MLSGPYNNFQRMIMLCLFAWLSVAPVYAEEENEYSSPIGMSDRVNQVVLPGTELEVKPATEKTPIVLRILDVYPHGTEFRYNLEYYGLKSGEFNLADFLQRKDRSGIKGLPEIKVSIQSTLSADQIEPNALKRKTPPFVGGYWLLVFIGGIIWIIGLLIIIFAKRKTKVDEDHHSSSKPVSLADRLKPMIEEAIAGRSSQAELASLEMNLVTLWRKRLMLEDLDASEAIIQLRQHSDAGPLLIQLEDWLHRPKNGKVINITEILKPYQDLPADSLHEEPANSEGTS